MIRAAIAALALSLAASAAAGPTLGPAYGSGMVLQRDAPLVLEGKSAPGERVTARMGDTTASAQAGADGMFRITLPARSASIAGVTLVLSDGTGETRYDDLRIGDVILCSGQSNMELPVTRALDTSNQLRLAADDALRLFKVPQATAPTPAADFPKPLGWVAADPATVADFSAACFYMGKRLRRLAPDVPVGLIHSNWGGSAARAWYTPAGVAAMEGPEALALLRTYATDPLAATRAFVPRWMDWWRASDKGREPWRAPATLDWKPIPQFSFWNDWTGTGLDTHPRANVWLRQSFTLSAQQAAQDGALSIGAIDDLDLTFVNGEAVGYTFGWGVERTYRVPARFLRPGKNDILIAANNMWDMGGFFAGPERLFFTPGDGTAAVPLGADWEYAIAAVEGVPPRAPWDANAGAGVMHNAMIAPLGPMRLAAVAWYQGEADVGQPAYDRKLATLFRGWRAQFGPQTRMLVVQLADYGQRTAVPTESGWAQLRQEQLAAVQADARADLVSAIDIGEPSDIHPANKNLLGDRLAEAFHGRAMPKPVSARREGDRLAVRFTGLEGDLIAFGGPTALGLELCGAQAESCRFVTPELDGQRLLIALPPGLEATRVRHAWADAPIVNLYDGAERPIPGFELPITE